MVNLMNFIREVSTDEHYTFVQKEKREACAKAFDRGVQCILKCQVKKDGKPTVWCAQHDELDYSPRPARAFEPMGLSGSESVARETADEPRSSGRHDSGSDRWCGLHGLIA